MPSLDTVNFSREPDSVMVYGPPKAGKTELVGQLAASHKLIWIDLENGGRTLSKLPQELKANVDYYKIYDTPDSPNAIETVLHLITGKAVTFCEAHGKVSCGDCLARKATMHTLELNKLDPAQYVVVIDSATQLTASATWKTVKQFNLKPEAKFEFDHWAYQGALLRRFFEYTQNARFNIVVISHETALKLEDGTDKIVPSSGTENFSRNVAKYFGHIVYCSVVNMKHKQAAHSTAYNKVLTGSRTDVVIDNNAESRNALLGCFQPKEPKPVAEQTGPSVAAATAIATAAPASTNPLLAKLRANKPQ
jgi:hypothetical protein